MKKYRDRNGTINSKTSVMKVFICGALVFSLNGCLGMSKKIYSTAVQSSSEESRTEETTKIPETTKSLQEEAMAEIQQEIDNGQYGDALARIKKLKNSTPELESRKEEIQQAVDQKKAELEGKLLIETDEVENVTFILPDIETTQGLIFYPYIGINESRKYMFLRIGFQEKIDSGLIGFKSIKVRSGEELIDIDFNPFQITNQVDIFGSGLTESVDVSVEGKILNLLEAKIPNTDEVLVRFSDISNTSKDYVVSEEQKQIIADILEYYSYLE